MVMVISGTCKPAVGAMVSLMQVKRCCIDKPTFYSKFKLDKHSLMPRSIVDADSVSDESTRKSLSSGDAEFLVLTLGCASEVLVMNCWGGMQLEHTTLKRSNHQVPEEQRRGSKRGE